MIHPCTANVLRQAVQRSHRFFFLNSFALARPLSSTSSAASASRSLISQADACRSKIGNGAASIIALSAAITATALTCIDESHRDIIGISIVSATLSTTYCDDPIPVYGIPGTNLERTFLAVKPDGVQRGLVGDIIARFEKRGYKLVGLKMVWPTPELAADHYSDLSTKKFFPALVKFFSSGPIVAMCWEGSDIIKQGRSMLGETQPLASKPGSIRGDYSIDLGRNICHGSDSPESARKELEMWFPEGVNDWAKTVDTWVYE
jgi:nucleoside-diphosphate kinase